MDFHSLPPGVGLGTASDRYAGWTGQIYSPGRYESRLIRRTHSVGGRTFTETVLPVESVEEYFEHFRVLELDFTFYRPLRHPDGRPTENFRLLRRYRRHLKAGNLILLKVPQAVFARKVRRGKSFSPNAHYLNADFFTEQFYAPAVEILGSHLRGFIFEQEYQRRRERVPAEEAAESLDRFFRSVPTDDRYQIELRTEAYLKAPVFEVFARHSLGQVLSHWTWLPPLSEQFARSGRRFFNPPGGCLIRLLTPRGMRYEDSYVKAFPFDRLVDGMADPRMVNDTVAIMREAVAQETGVTVIVNNRAGGSAPLIAKQIADKFQKEK